MGVEQAKTRFKGVGVCAEAMETQRKCVLGAEFACSGVIGGEDGGNRLRCSAGIWDKSHEALMTAGENVPVRIGGGQLDVDAPDADGDCGGYFEQFETDRSDRGMGQLRALQTEGAHTLQKQVGQGAEG